MTAIAFANYPAKQRHVRREFGFVVQTPRGWELINDRLLKSFLAMGAAGLTTETLELKNRPPVFRPGAFK